MKAGPQLVKKGKRPDDSLEKLEADIAFFRIHLQDLECRCRVLAGRPPKKAA
jgi:hypothetical protein